MIKILGKIELPPTERRINFDLYKIKLEKYLAQMSQEINQEYGDFLEVDGSIKMENISELDQKIISSQEESWARDEGKTVDGWKESRGKNPATMAELAVSVLLHKAIGDKFIIARASKFDDYQNGVDNVLIDRENGNIVCGFDEVLGREGNDGSEKKKLKLMREAERGGINIRYGATIEKGELKRKSFRNIPAFYLGLSKDELGKTLESLDKDAEMSESEKLVLNKLFVSLETQINDLENNENVRDANLKRNLANFKDSLAKMMLK